MLIGLPKEICKNDTRDIGSTALFIGKIVVNRMLTILTVDLDKTAMCYFVRNWQKKFKKEALKPIHSLMMIYISGYSIKGGAFLDSRIFFLLMLSFCR
jgi:hypothetical protein